MTRLRFALLIAACVGLADACAHKAPATPGPHPTRTDRAAVLARAEIWTETDVPSMDMRAGPQGKGALAPFSEVTCTFIDRQLGGHSPKFSCVIEPGDEVRIKYGERNAEVYAAVATTRLLWALGFAADRWYPVSVVCHGCPSEPQRDTKPAGGDVRFEVAALERKLPGKTFETRPDEGWKWAELDLVQESAGGATVAQRDALTLLAVMLQHTDSKAKQQRINCTDENPDKAEKSEAADKSATVPCAHPVMFVHDVGLTFGKANLFNKQSSGSVNFENWKSKPIWKDARTCTANLSKSWTGSLNNPVISEAGRKFLADLLNQLTDAQLTDLFEVARFPKYSGVPAADWVALFKAKRAEISSVTCTAKPRA
jgi:hypothetical protein